jgi:UDP-glucuronate 4-epimerase
MAYWTFSERILAGEPIVVFNHGEMQRDFTYVDDAVEGVARLVAVGSSGALGRHEIINIGNGEPVRLLDYVSVLERALGREAVVQPSPMHTGDVLATHAAVSRLQALTGYRPQTPISVGIPRFVEWYLSQPEIARIVAERRRPA